MNPSVIISLVKILVYPENSYGASWGLGKGDIVFSFFSSISYHLEGVGNWGKRFPHLLLGLCDHGIVENQNLDAFRCELEIIQKELKHFTILNTIQDIEDLSKPFPWNITPGCETDTLDEIWCTPRGNISYFETFYKGIEDAKRRNTALLLVYAPETANRDTLRTRKNKGREYWLGMLPINHGDEI